ncbi:hypothetical protein BVAVS116_H0110 (plasmid) [Borreliella valaisiana VS116]|uniref:Uncharacterized protein n=1 Tax=Borreliella valaisiana VS116 TaxID=445987 RepID=C0R925_BORVA|nr:hypothetical protein BVAVS116_H0110 [Borreliella valaisiana VS116]
MEIKYFNNIIVKLIYKHKRKSYITIIILLKSSFIALKMQTKKL